MAQAQTLETVIALRGRVDNSVALLGDRITLIGSQVNRLSQQLIRFGKDSLDVYREYEQNMADAEAALRTGTYRNRVGELDSIMEKLNEHASEWARTTKFHTSDVSAAISKAAHAGWDYLDMLEGIPAAMLLAQGGSMDLEESLDYLVKALNATDTEFKDTNKLIDQWITGANLGATNAQEFGDAILRMGNTAMFADSTEELFTLLTVLANVGTTGSTAGTMLRNGMIRLVAPTTQARAAMELLGASSEEIEEVLSDKTISKAAQELHELGFSAFDDAGNLKPMLQIFKDLDKVTKGLSEQRRDQLLSAIFPMRSITGALAILEAAKENYGDLYEMIRDSEGAAKIASDIQMDTLEGRIEIFKSKWEELKRITGERLAPKIEAGADWLGGIIDSISTMDDAKFEGLINGFMVIAGAGPALLAVGLVLKLIGSLGTAGVFGAGVVTALAAAIGLTKRLNEIDNKKLADKFGSMNWDTTHIKNYIGEIGKEFDVAFDEIEKFKRGVEEAAETYQTSSESLSGELLSHYITKADFTDADKQKIYQLADQMYTSLDGAIKERAAQDMSLAAWLFDSDNTDQNYVDLIDLIYADYSESLVEAQRIGEDLRAALTDAFTDGMTDEEYEKILQYMREYNEAMARAAAEAKSEEEYIEYQKMLWKAQTASLDDIKDIADTAATRRDAQIAEGEDYYLTMRYRAAYRGASESELAAIDKAWENKKAEIGSQYDDIIYTLWDTTIKQSDLSDVYDYALDVADKYLSGAITGDEGVKMIKDAYGTNKYANDPGWSSTDREKLGKILIQELGYYGGYEGALKQLRYYEQIGDAEGANQIKRLIAMEGLINDFNPTSVVPFKDGTLAKGISDFFGAEVMWNTGSFGVYLPRRNTSKDLNLETESPTAETSTVKSQETVQSTVFNMQIPKESLDSSVDEAQSYLDENPGSWNVNVTFGGYSTPTGGTNFFGGGGGGVDRSVLSNMLYGEGGRATEPSIFGEAGAEWAIPEEHSDRTAMLLDAVRQASGFTWPELIDTNGGMNANAENVPTTFVYSPTIYANDASGVEEKLREDKKNLEKWWRNKQMEGDVAAYG